MLQRFLFIGITALALVCTMGLPGWAHAHHGRGGSYNLNNMSYYHRNNGGHSRPNYGGIGYDEADRNFGARRFNRGSSGYFRKSFGGRGSAGLSEPQFYVGL
jgi:hypothetical protein